MEAWNSCDYIILYFIMVLLSLPYRTVDSVSVMVVVYSRPLPRPPTVYKVGHCPGKLYIEIHSTM